MRDLIRIGAIALVAVVLIILALVLLVPSGGRERRNEPPPNTDIFVPGIYTSTIILNNKPVEVRVAVSEEAILYVYLSDMSDVQRVFFPLFEPRMQDLADEILRYQSAYINPQTDYPVTTDILHRAVKAALELAAVGEP